MTEIKVDMPGFMSRRRAASRVEPEARDSKQARVLQQAEEAATAGGGGSKPSKQNTLIQLVLILTRMSLMQARELAEITGVVFKCFLLPLPHIISKLTMEGGDEYQAMVTERRERLDELAKASAGKKGKGKKKDKEELSGDESSGMETEEVVEQLPSPHVYIALKAIGGMIQAGSASESKEALATRQKLKEAWDQEIKGKDEEHILKNLKVWRGRRPQKQSKGPKHMKLILCISDPLQELLATYLLQTDCKQKIGQAPRGYLEREAATLMKKLSKS